MSWFKAAVSRPSRTEPSEEMLSSRLVTIACQPITPVIVRAREPVNEPTPTVTVATTALARAIQPAPWRIRVRLGVGDPSANTKVAINVSA